MLEINILAAQREKIVWESMFWVIFTWKIIFLMHYFVKISKFVTYVAYFPQITYVTGRFSNSIYVRYIYYIIYRYM